MYAGMSRTPAETDNTFRRKNMKSGIILLAGMIMLMSLGGCAKQEEKTDPASPVKTVTVNNRKMDYLRFGNEDGEKFVILPGLALKSVMNSADAIINAYSLLAENYDVFLFDHVREEPEGYDIQAMASDTLEAFRQLNIEHAHLMGVSMGGMTAQTIAAQEPQRVSSLILCSTAMNLDHSDPAVFEKWKELAEKKDAAALMKAFGESVYTPSFYEQYKDYIIASGEGTSDLDYQNFLISLEGIRNFDISDEIRKITCPVYVMAASEDRILGVEASYDIIDALSCKSHVFEGYGHGVYDEAPDYLTYIDSFLKSISHQ